MKKSKSIEEESQGEIQVKKTNAIKNKQITKLKELPEDFFLVEIHNYEPRLSKMFLLQKVINNNMYQTTYLRFGVDTKKEAIALALCEIDKFKKNMKFAPPYTNITKKMKPFSELEMEEKWSKNPRTYKYANFPSSGYLSCIPTNLLV